MMRGDKLALLSVSLIVAGCVTDHKLEVRAIPQPKGRYSGGVLDRARAELAYGSVGLALEDFRTLQRQQGDSAEVFSGIAACYAAMGRYDLARTNYELALAYAPNEPRLLLALAATLERSGEAEQAAEVRAEAARLTAAPTPQAPSQEAAVTPLGVPHASSITVKLPPPANRQEATAGPKIDPPRSIAAEVSLANVRVAMLDKPDLSAIVATLGSIDIPVEPDKQPQLSPMPAIARASAEALADLPVSISMKPVIKPRTGFPLLTPMTVEADVATLPKEHRDARLLSADDRAPPPAPPPSPSPARVEMALSEEASASGPHLERASAGEVLLVTMPRPVPLKRVPARAIDTKPLVQLALAMNDGPRPPAVARPDFRPTALQWVPLKYANGGQNVQLLNAARTDRLAARTRQALLDRGWRKIGIGNARQVRQHSLVLYAAGRAPLAFRIAAHFRCKAVQAQVRAVVVLLGRDAVARSSSARA